MLIQSKIIKVLDKNKKIKVSDSMQKRYEYTLVEPVGKNFDPEFKPDLTPQQMLEFGVFGGLYMSDKPKEFPREWFEKAKLSPDHKRHKELNFFNVDASQSLREWLRKGWIDKHDPRGWFQWYCRYYMGRRMPREDQRQIKRWKAMRRHLAQVAHNCRPGDVHCRTRQRQALLHWAYDSRKF